ncbi:InlB B-repeat-containing protein, partial [Lactococcus sp. dk322]|uniref:InlB B-repeat-containing protein n=1 Tax=Lactococcus sp. dk322 TaxID=2603290 RepID=UPI0011C950DF
ALTANTMTKDGYTFQGWATSATGAVVYKDKAEVKNLATSGDVTLYAVWKSDGKPNDDNKNDHSSNGENSNHKGDTDNVNGSSDGDLPSTGDQNLFPLTLIGSFFAALAAAIFALKRKKD